MIFTRCEIEFTMPRTEGVSSSSRVRFILFRPRPFSVSRWMAGRRIGLPISLIYTVVVVAMVNLLF